jgi:hypothetical protein
MTEKAAWEPGAGKRAINVRGGEAMQPAPLILCRAVGRSGGDLALPGLRHLGSRAAAGSILNG